METFSALLALCEGNQPVTDVSPLTKASGAELRCFLWSVPEQTVGQTIETLVIWDAIALIMMSLKCLLLPAPCHGRIFHTYLNHTNSEGLACRALEPVAVHYCDGSCRSADWGEIYDDGGYTVGKENCVVDIFVVQKRWMIIWWSS